MAKIMKDTMPLGAEGFPKSLEVAVRKQEEVSEEREPGWRSSASPEEIVERQKAAEERAREEVKKWEQKEGA